MQLPENSGAGRGLLGIYMFWWFYDQMEKPNRHFFSNWAEEDGLVKVVEAVS